MRLLVIAALGIACSGGSSGPGNQKTGDKPGARRAKYVELITRLLTGAFAPSIPEIAAGVRLLAERNKIVAEGAGAVAVAAARRDGAPTGKIVCIVSGGCIDAPQLATILAGGVP